jgi:hypothetical protein
MVKLADVTKSARVETTLIDDCRCTIDYVLYCNTN